MSGYELNEQQVAAVEAGGEVFVSAGAGTGKTAVLVERVVRAVCDRGLDVDSILVITYTRRAAGELRTRIRAAFAERGWHDLARQLDGAWISTIHGFCARLLKAYPLAAGLDPRFRELDEAQAAVLRSEAFRAALAEFCAGDVLIFGMFTMHGSINNTSDRFRISSDTRDQLAPEPVDERWIGAKPKAHYAWTKGETVPMEEARAKWGV